MLLSLDLNLLPNTRLIGYVSYKKPWVHFSRTTNEYVLYIIKSGKMFIKEGINEYALNKGDLLILEPNILHIGYREALCDYYYIHFMHPNIRQVIDKSEENVVDEIMLKRKLSLTSDLYSDMTTIETECFIPKYYHIENENTFFYTLNETIDDYNKKYENYKKVASCRLIDLFIRISREYASTKIEGFHKNYPKSFIKVRHILNYLNSNYQKKITSSEIALLFESNYNYLNRIFERITGYTIFSYLNIIRVNKAKELIYTTDMPFGEIGYLVGVDDPYYFSKLFKKVSGITPTEYYQGKFNI